MHSSGFGLCSATAKLGRAQFHLNEAQRISSQFVQTSPYTIIEQIDRNGCGSLSVTAIRNWPPELALAIGDAAGCVRAALDQIAFACVSGRPDENEQEAIEFPICTTVQQFDSAMGTLRKWLSPAALPIFERFQPVPHPKIGDARYLAILREVNNRHKHSALSILLGLANRVTFSAEPSSAIADVDACAPNILEAGTVLARFKVREEYRYADVKVHSRLVMVPVFGDGIPQAAAGESAITAITKAHNLVATEILPVFSAL